ncbi:MAG TPA: hypothetical protein VLS89_08870 [Candidatus Nanopelagicales bacterium]|nr:hypothetical protein [Candidatus Nanopelagicales bacterium]
MKHAMMAGLAALALIGAGCKGGSDEAKPEGAAKQGQAPQAGQQVGQQSAAGKQPAGAGAQDGTPAVTTQVAAQGYDLAAIKTIPDGCASPAVILATAPKSVGPSYEWAISRQALLANQQFKIVDGAPTAPGQISLDPYEYNGSAYALIARCKDGGTCNQVAAMYKAIVRSSRPQVICGPVQGLGASPVGSFRWDATPQGNLPGAKDTVAACARLSACQIATDRATPGDPFLECQKAPHKHKTDCATRYPCAEVLACMGR